MQVFNWKSAMRAFQAKATPQGSRIKPRFIKKKVFNPVTQTNQIALYQWDGMKYVLVKILT